MSDCYFDHCKIKCAKAIVYSKKSHTCEEGWAQLRISSWHLLMNLKNKYLFEKLLK